MPTIKDVNQLKHSQLLFEYKNYKNLKKTNLIIYAPVIKEVSSVRPTYILKYCKQLSMH